MDMTTKCATDDFSPFVMSVRFGNEKRDPVNTGSRYQNLAVKEGFEPYSSPSAYHYVHVNNQYLKFHEDMEVHIRTEPCPKFAPSL